MTHLKTHFSGNVPLNEYAAAGHSCVDFSSFLKMANLPNVSLETVCLHPPDPCMADAHGIGSACAEYQRAFIESRLWRNANRAKEHAADNIALVAKGMLLLIVA